MEDSSILFEEYNNLSNKGMPDILTTVGLFNDYLYEWRCTMIGPQDSLYDKGLFYLKIKFPNDYPNNPPQIYFITPIYHLNVNHLASSMIPLGNVSLTALNNWKPEYRMKGILPNIFALFYMTNTNSNYYGEDRKNELLYNKELYEQKVRYFTLKYANIENDNVNQEYNYWDFTYNN